jgi:hypothetical protein
MDCTTAFPDILASESSEEAVFEAIAIELGLHGYKLRP